VGNVTYINLNVPEVLVRDSWRRR